MGKKPVKKPKQNVKESITKNASPLRAESAAVQNPASENDASPEGKTAENDRYKMKASAKDGGGRVAQVIKGI